MNIELKAHQVMKSIGLASDDLVDSLSGQRFPLTEDSWGSITPFFPELAAAAIMPVVPPITQPPEVFHLHLHTRAGDGGLEHETICLTPEMRIELLAQLNETGAAPPEQTNSDESLSQRVARLTGEIPLRSGED